MGSDFAVKISLLRREQNISQKQAAEDLGISQALLSHYEKGIRECGLHFVVKAADYYQVSCDYLLGRTNRRSPAGVSFSEQELPGTDPAQAVPPFEHSRRKLSNSLNIVFGILEKINSPALGEAAGAYLSSALYMVFRALASAGPKSGARPFRLENKGWESQMSLALAMHHARLLDILNGENPGTRLPVEKGNFPLLSTDQITRLYPRAALSLLELLENVERDVPRLWPEDTPKAQHK